MPHRWGRRFVNEGNQDIHRHERRDNSYPEHGLEMARCQPHQYDRQQWPEDSAYGIERLTQAERRAAQLDRRNIGHQRIAWAP